MTPIKFKEQNMTFTRPADMTDEQCSSLPAYRGEGQLISCWKMSFRERMKALFTGIVWFGLLGQSQPPIWLAVDRPFVKQETELDDNCTTTCDYQKDGKCTHEPWARRCCTSWSKREPQGGLRS